MSKSNLSKLAKKFEAKLGIVPSAAEKSSEVKLPKRLNKLAKAEVKLQTKIAKQQDQFLKIASGPSVKYSGGFLPAVYHVCEACQGVGKVAINRTVPNFKFASTKECLTHCQVAVCSDCNGKRVIKAVDDSNCSEQQLMTFAAEEEEKEDKKLDKKGKKALKKAAKAEKKAEEKKLALEDPEKYAALKAEKKDKKSKKKAEKSVKKAFKKAEKAKAKAAPWMKKDEE